MRTVDFVLLLYLQRRKNANLTRARTVEFVENLWKMRITNVNVYMDTEAKIVKVYCLNVLLMSMKNSSDYY